MTPPGRSRAPGAGLAALWFDGRSARGTPVVLHLERSELVARGADLDQRSWPLAEVQWPERTRHGRRVIHLPGGGSIEVDATAEFDAWRKAHGPREGWVVRVQQNWRATLAALLVLVLVLFGGYRWGVPLAAAGLAGLVPADAERALGDAVLEQIGGEWFAPSQLAAERQEQLRVALAAAVAATYAADDRPRWELHFRRGGEELGANALALPGGHIVITDELVALLEGHDDAIVGVLGHEYGHVRRRHGLQAVVRFGLVSTVSAIALGDFSSVLASAPALLATAAYSRDAEREADADAAQLLLASGRSPEVMLELFTRLGDARRTRGGGRLPIAFASHPHDEERQRFFREAARPGAR